MICHDQEEMICQSLVFTFSMFLQVNILHVADLAGIHYRKAFLIQLKVQFGCVVVALMDCEMFPYRTHRIQPFLHFPSMNPYKTTLPYKFLLCSHITICACSVVAHKHVTPTCMWKSSYACTTSQILLEAHDCIKFGKSTE